MDLQIHELEVKIGLSYMIKISKLYTIKIHFIILIYLIF